MLIVSVLQEIFSSPSHLRTHLMETHKVFGNNNTTPSETQEEKTQVNIICISVMMHSLETMTPKTPPSVH